MTDDLNLPRVAVDNPELTMQTCWLPPWLERSLAGVTRTFDRTKRPDGSHLATPAKTLAKNLAPTDTQRAQIKERVKSLRAAMVFFAPAVAMVKVTGTLLAFPMERLTEATAAARAEAYMISLHDIATFAVIEACNRWLRAEVEVVKEKDGATIWRPNFDFGPSAPRLRLIAQPIERLLEYQAKRLEDLLAARVVPDERAAKAA